jgi:hypothetical protein
MSWEDGEGARRMTSPTRVEVIRDLRFKARRLSPIGFRLSMTNQQKIRSTSGLRNSIFGNMP